MKSQVYDGARRESYQVPGVKVRRVQQGVHCQQQQRLNLIYVARRQGSIGKRHGSADKVHPVVVLLIVDPAALRGGTYSEYKIQHPVVGVLDDTIILAIHVVQDSQERCFREARE